MSENRQKTHTNSQKSFQLVVALKNFYAQFLFEKRNINQDVSFLDLIYDSTLAKNNFQSIDY